MFYAIRVASRSVRKRGNSEFQLYIISVDPACIFFCKYSSQCSMQN